MKTYTVSRNSSDWANGRGFEVQNPNDPEAGSSLFETKDEADAYAAQKNAKAFCWPCGAEHDAHECLKRALRGAK